MTHSSGTLTEGEVLDRKKRVLKRWAVGLSILAILSCVALGAAVLDRMLTGAPGGGLRINVSKAENKLAWLGSEIRDVNETISRALGLSSADGVVINDVEKGSPANGAGLQRGDVILTFNGTQIRDSFHIQEEMLKHGPGDTVRLLVDKADGGKRIVYVRLGARPSGGGASKGADLKKVANEPDGPGAPARLSTAWGISVSPLTLDLREQFNVPSAEQGAVIVAVVKDSLADQRGLEVGDVIKSVNKIPTPNLQSFYLALRQDEGVLMDIYSPEDGKRFFVTLPDEGDSPPQAVMMSFDDAGRKENRLAVASDRNDVAGAVYYRFSSSPYFILYDSAKKEMTATRNPYAAQPRGAGIAVAQMLTRQNIDAAIVGGIGPQALDAFLLAKVKVYGGVTGSVRDAIANYQSGRLKELEKANLAGYGYSSSSAVISRAGSRWTEDPEDEEEEGYRGQPETIPPKGKASETRLTAGSEARANRPAVCVCPNCGAEVTHPSSVSCSEMACPICGSRLMTASPGSESGGAPEVSTGVPSRTGPIGSAGVALSGGAPTTVPPGTAQKVASNLWAMSSRPQDLPSVTGQQTAGVSTGDIPISRVSTCCCPLCGTTVTHPIGIPCASLQCPTCGARMVSATTPGSAPVAAAGGMQTGGKPEGIPPVQQVYYLLPLSSKPENVPLLGQGQQGAVSPAAGGPTQGGPNTGGPASGGPAVDGPSMAGGQAGTGLPQSGLSTVCICPVCRTTVTHPVGVPCASLTCPVCGSRLVNAEPGGASGGAAALTGGSPMAATGGMQTGGKPEGVPPVQQTYYLVPVSSKPENVPFPGQGQQVAYVLIAGGPTQGGPNTGGPGSGGPAVEGASMAGGLAGTGSPQSGLSTVCICPVCKTTVTHPIGIPCASLTCPVCGSRLLNAEPGGSPMAATGGMQTGGSPMAATGGMQTGGSPMAATGGMQTGGSPMAATGGMQTGGSPMAATGGMQTGGKPEGVPPVQQAYYLVPVSSKPEGVPFSVRQGQQVAYVLIAGGPTQGGPNTGGPASGGPAVDGSSMGGGQAGTGSPQSGRSTLCICPMCRTTVTHPIGIPCASLTCPVCGSRLLNAEPGGTSGGAAALTGGSPMAATGGMQTGGKPEGVPPVQQAYYLVPVSGKPENVPFPGQGQQVAYVLIAGGPTQGGPNTGGPASGGPAVDGSSMGGGQAGTGSPQSGRSTLCICFMCKTTVTHPIGVPCVSLTCPVCGSRLVNAQPGGASGGAAGMIPSGAAEVAQSTVIHVSAVSKRIVVPSTGRSLKSDIAPLFDKAPYFIMFALGKYDAVRNPYYRDTGAIGAEVAQFVVGEGGAVVISSNISMTALRTLRDLKVRVYTGFTGPVQQALDIYADGRLKDSGTIPGIVIEGSTEDEHGSAEGSTEREHASGGGGGPPSSKDKKKDKDSKVF